MIGLFQASETVTVEALLTHEARLRSLAGL